MCKHSFPQALFALALGISSSTVATMETVRNKQDHILHYGVGGVLAGFIAGGLDCFLERTPAESVVFRPRGALRGMALLGSLGVITGFIMQNRNKSSDIDAAGGGVGKSGIVNKINELFGGK